MTGASASHDAPAAASHAGSAETFQRWGVALCASLLLHGILLADPPFGGLTSSELTGAGPLPLRARLRLLPTAVTPQAGSKTEPRPVVPTSAPVPTVAAGATAATQRQEADAQSPAPGPAPKLEAAPPEDSLLSRLTPADDALFGKYRALTEVDVRPGPLVQIEPQYPLAQDPPVPGKALLMIFVGIDGLVDAVRILNSEPGPAFGENARAAFLVARFTPAEVAARPVPVYMTIEVNF